MANEGSATSVSDLERAEHLNVGNGKGVKRISEFKSDGVNLLQETSNQVAKKITVSGGNTYVATAPIGTAQSAAAWQVKCINVTGGDTVITWCDGDALFNNVATDLSILSYL